MLIDTHAHIYLDSFDDDFDQVLRRAREADIEKIIMPAIDVQSIEQALALCERHEGLFCMAALHPSETNKAEDADFEAVRSFCDNSFVVAVGETGLDYYWDRSFDDRQHDFLRRHIRLAIEKDLPIVLHNRDATDDLIRILREEKGASANPEKMRGIFHCFGGPAEAVPQILDLGFCFGLGGTFTFKNGGVPDATSSIPVESIVLETDAPYLAPVPFRGKRNEPSYLKYVAQRVAEARGLSYEELSSITSATARRLFRLAGA